MFASSLARRMEIASFFYLFSIVKDSHTLKKYRPAQLQNLIPEGGKNTLCSLKNMDKVGETYTPEEVKTEEEQFKAMLFFLRAYEHRYGKLFEYMRKADF